ncbi:MAG: hypothetical protein U9O56_06130 [Campylobacterota bacterium]|nr:hypothetical protein [Campylobacterota bacterium]
MSKFFRDSVSILSISILFVACTHKEVKVHQKGDELLNCSKLTTKIADLIDLNDEINNDTGLENTSLFSWIMFPPIGGYNQVKASMSRDKLDDRFYHLMDLKLKNKCKFTSSEKVFIKDKGRFSDFFD